MSFGKAFLSSCLGALTAMVVFFLLTFLFFTALVAGLSDDKQVVVKDNSVLHLELDAQVTELEVDDPLAGLPFPGQQKRIGLIQLKQAIDDARQNDNIEGVYVEIRQPLTGFSSLEEIRRSLLDFRESGKWVVAYSEVMTEGAYYLASAADEVYLHPEGEMEFNGLSVSIGFYKKLLDKLEIKPQVFRVGEFKSAVEPFLLEELSKENRLQLTEMVNGIYDNILDNVAESRGIDRTRLEEISDQMLVRNADDALELKLVDGLLYQDEFHNVIREKLTIPEDEDIRFVKYKDYRKSFSTYKRSPNEVAVIVAEGTIVQGEGSQSDLEITAEKYVKEIRKARKNDNVKAIVLRVNSPGGAYTTSDMIWREVKLAAAEKPVIASMSDYAASGGYYIAMACDTIVAQPNTITGSIGIFGVMFDMSSFLGNKLGVTFDEVRTGDFGDLYTVTRPLTPAERNIIQRNLEKYYDSFTAKAAEGRSVSQEQILRVASGRVWTGQQALEHKLVDVLGGIDDAIRIAAEKANIVDDYKVRYYPAPTTFIEQLMKGLETSARAGLVRQYVGDLYPMFERVRQVKQYEGIQARMPFEFEFH